MSRQGERPPKKVVFGALNVGVVGWEFLYYLEGHPLRAVLENALVCLILLNFLAWVSTRRRRSDSRTEVR